MNAHAEPSAVLLGEHLHALRSRLHGDLVLPTDPEWDAARTAWQLTVDQRPAAVALVADASDVVEVVSSARKLGLRVAPQSTGHAAGAIASLDGAILLRTSRLGTVEIDADTGVARIGAGVVWGTVAEAAARHGWAPVAGMSATVGVVGFLLGGGIGWLARSHGPGIDSVRALDAVDAAGRIVHIDAQTDAELFAAVRAGVAPVVVTAVELQLHRLPALVAGSLLWPIAETERISRAWATWARDSPDTVTSLVRVLRFPPLPEVPEPLRGGRFVAVEAALQGDEAAALLAPLRELAPAVDAMRRMTPAELSTVHGDPPRPTPAYGESVLIDELSDAAVGAFAAAALAPSAEALLSIELRQLGGALTAVPGAGLVFAVGIVPVPEALPPVRGAVEALVARFADVASARRSKNFCDRPAPAETLYGPDVDRLRALVADRDPDGLLVAGHPLR